MSRLLPTFLSSAFLICACSKAPAPVRQKVHVERLGEVTDTKKPEAGAVDSTKAQAPRVESWGPRQEGSLSLGQHLAAATMVPSGQGASPLRVVISAHGAGGRGIDHCRFWDRYLAADILLICLTGTPLRSREPEGGAYFKSHLALREEVEDALDAAKKHWGDQLAPSDWLYLGYSQGATMGALALLMDPPLVGSAGFSHLVLVEGGGENWTRGRVSRWAQSGGQAVGLICGTSSCAQHARRSLPLFQAEKGATGVSLSIDGGGHTYGGRVTPAVQDVLERFGYGSSLETP